MGTGSDYIRKEDVEELFDKFWNALREDLLPGGAGVSRVDVGNCLINQLVQSLGQVAKDHGVRWTQELFDGKFKYSQLPPGYKPRTTSINRIMRTSQQPVWMQMAFGPTGTELRARVSSIPKLLSEIREGLCGDGKSREERESVASTEIAHSQNADSRRSGKRIEASKPDDATAVFGSESAVTTHPVVTHVLQQMLDDSHGPLGEKLYDKTKSVEARQSTESSQSEEARNGIYGSEVESVFDGSVGNNDVNVLSYGGHRTREGTSDSISEEDSNDSLSDVGTLLNWAEGKITEMPGGVSKFRRTSGRSGWTSTVRNWLDCGSLSTRDISKKRPRSPILTERTGTSNPSRSCHIHVSEGKKPKLE